MGQRQRTETQHARPATYVRLYLVPRPHPIPPPPTDEHPPDTCQWCGQEPTAYSSDGTAWCIAHAPADHPY